MSPRKTLLPKLLSPEDIIIPPIRVIAILIKALLFILSLNIKYARTTINNGCVFTKTAELAIDVYLIEVIHVAKCNARNTPLSMHSPKLFASIVFSSSLDFNRVEGVIKITVMASLYVDIMRAGAVDALIRTDEKDTKITPITTISLGFIFFKDITFFQVYYNLKPLRLYHKAILKIC
jgi:hypothetical protein